MKHEELQKLAKEHFKVGLPPYNDTNEDSFVKGFIRGHNMANLNDISDKEIEEGAEPYFKGIEGNSYLELAKRFFHAGAKWYRLELLKRSI